MISAEVIRAVKDLINVLDGAEKTASEIKTEYKRVLDELPYEAYTKTNINTGLVLAEAIYLASLVEKTRTLQNLYSYVETLPKGEKRVIFEDFINASPTRFTNLVKMLEQIDREMPRLASREAELGEKALDEVEFKTYERGNLKAESWGGSNYRNRVAQNVSSTGDLIKKEAVISFLMGRSQRQARSSLGGFLLKGSELARRLIRTESTRVHCQAKVRMYKKQGYTKYRYVAVLDKRTSKMCRAMNGREFYLDEAVVGINLPPLHPWCRSTIIPIKE